MTISLTNGDCLKLMKNLPDKSVDLFICDLPYGETNCKWDSVIDLEEFWKEFKRLRKSKKTACIHFCSTKFGYTLIKSNEKMFKMDMVWKKRNKTGGLQSRHRPMRNHEMVYFFYEQAPKYNRDTYHKRIQAKKEHNIEKENITMGKTSKHRKSEICFDPPNPASVVEEADANKATIYKDKVKGNKDPLGMDAEFKKIPFKLQFEPPNPASVIEEETNYMGKTKKQVLNSRSENGKKHLATFDPPNPASVVEEDLIEPAEDEPKSMFESKKVFIGKRHHQTEKPLDILEFFIKYWSDEGQTILDPTMGSGSTGVACKTLKRNFIGYEMDEKIFKVAETRIDKVKII